MDEKLAYRAHQSTYTSHPTIVRPHKRPSRRVLYFYLLALLLCSLLLYHIEILTPVIRVDKDYLGLSGSSSLVSNETIKVALEAHVMSKCPDARDCLRDMVVPAMEKIGNKVDFKLSFIGEYA